MLTTTTTIIIIFIGKYINKTIHLTKMHKNIYFNVTPMKHYLIII